jgi:enoyl-CoA hydratase
VNAGCTARAGGRAGSGAVTLHLDGHVATVTLDRPAKLNALTPEMLDALGEVIAKANATEARVILFRGAGEKAFCVGADIDRFVGLGPLDMWQFWAAKGHEVLRSLSRLRQPTVAVLHGAALGGGFELALACDFRVVTREARLGMPEVGLGTVPGWGGTERLTDLVGRARAKELVLARRVLDGQTAYEWGLANRVAAEEELETALAALVGELVAGAPKAVQLAKQLIDAAGDGAPQGVLEPLASGLAATTKDLGEGVAAFRERRSPDFHGA